MEFQKDKITKILTSFYTDVRILTYFLENRNRRNVRWVLKRFYRSL